MALAQMRKAADSWVCGFTHAQLDLRKEDLSMGGHKRSAVPGEAVDDCVRLVLDNGWSVAEAMGGRVVYRQLQVTYIAAIALLEEIVGGRPSKRRFENMLRLNQYLPMVSFRLMGEVVVATIAFPADNLQPEEQDLLTRWLANLEGRLRLADAATAP
jgi:hypothetical protein